MYAEYQRLLDEHEALREAHELSKENLVEAMQALHEQCVMVDTLRAESNILNQRISSLSEENEALCNTIDRLNRELAQLKKNDGEFW